MNKLVVTLILASCAASAQGQTFLNHIQTRLGNGASVTVNEDAKIDELVNNVSAAQNVVHNATKGKTPKTLRKTNDTDYRQEASYHHQTAEQQHTTAEQQHTEKGQQYTADERQHTTHPVTASATQQHKERHDSSEQHKAKQTEEQHKSELPEIKSDTEEEDEMEIPVVDLRKKVMRKSYKVEGFRVQVFAGGNSRKDRQAAENAGRKMKMCYPEVPVYTHFYSPRWICRIGNYRSYGEAATMLRNVQKLGYKSAVIVKGKISIQY